MMRTESMEPFNWRVMWTASKTGAKWFSPPLREFAAKATAESAANDFALQASGITARAEPIPTEGEQQ